MLTPLPLERFVDPLTRLASVLPRLLFFFQAEDGIRDGHVTGVQTCALPISRIRALRPRAFARVHPRSRARAETERLGPPGNPQRSEERRVGKECRSWW